jgi:HAD superfamily hydrolase (TIGR01549 family)
VTAVLFDWDGTLCDSAAAHMRAFAAALADFGLGFTREQYQAVYTPAWYRMYAAFGLPEADWKKADERWLFHYRDEAPGLMRGAEDVLRAFEGAGLGMGIVTGGTRRRIDRELELLRLTARIATVICHEDVIAKKPDPEGIRKALAMLDTPAADSWFVGDTPEDVQMGRNAGVRTVAVVSDYVGRERLARCGADWLLEDILGLPGLLLGRDSGRR